MDDDVARLDEGEQQGRDRRHARGEAERILRLFPEAEPVLENLLIGAVEARIDQALRPARTLAGDALEVALAGGGILEDEGGGEEDGRLQRTFRERRVEAVAHHQSGRLQLAPVDFERALFGAAARIRAGKICFVCHV